jgi:hypothetical protein
MAKQVAELFLNEEDINIMQSKKLSSLALWLLDLFGIQKIILLRPLRCSRPNLLIFCLFA